MEFYYWDNERFIFIFMFCLFIILFLIIDCRNHWKNNQ
ncbi:Hypothetical protein NGK_0599 [Neisseria gonorrhoeae NCCP11945]|uniref:Uncharacterized protein n=1 Tax=Neisseria gonorrhoeae (strain NCCP11945) TaxID=521006 RepID=B4RKD9_NEIG2|nr:Hypothetical protein NGK_0599 [Neisseria gonorrhoeae NCCP11945]